MKSRQDRSIAAIGILAGIMLLSILLGNHIPLPAQTLTYALALQLLFAILIQNSLNPALNVKPYRIAYAAVSTLMAAIVIGILLLDRPPNNPNTRLAGMEPATALLVFGISLGPFAYIFLWITGFHRVILSKHTTRNLDEQKEKRASKTPQ